MISSARILKHRLELPLYKTMLNNYAAQKFIRFSGFKFNCPKRLLLEWQWLRRKSATRLYFIVKHNSEHIEVTYLRTTCSWKGPTSSHFVGRKYDTLNIALCDDKRQEYSIAQLPYKSVNYNIDFLIRTF